MPGCLPPTVCLVNPLVIYSSPSVIYACCLLGAIMTELFLVHVFVNFLSISEHCETITSPELSVRLLDIFFQPYFWLHMLD